MNDAQSLFREGVLALKEQKDSAEARRLLTQSLRIDPQNEMAWLWLARAMSSPEKRMQCIDRALTINPTSEQALALKQYLATLSNGATPHKNGAKESPKQATEKLTVGEEKRIRALLRKADQQIESGDIEGAIENWVHVLDIQVDHELAMRHAVGYLSRLKYVDDARELVWRALDSGTRHPSIYLTAIDIAKHQGDTNEANALREKLARLPDIDDDVVAMVIDHLTKEEQVAQAIDLLSEVIENHPRSQKLLTRMGDLLKMSNQDAEALRYYDRAARLGTGTKEGREADKKLLDHAPLLTDKERGSMALAWREAAGFALIFLILGWHDAGLNLLSLDLSHWLGVLLGLVGGYLVVTATSSPQQKPLASLLGGEKPKRSEADDEARAESITELSIIPPATRAVIGMMGAVTLIVGFTLVFSTALTLVMNPVAPIDIPTLEDLLTGSWW